MKIVLISTDSCIVAHGLRSVSAVLKSSDHEVILLFLPLLKEPYALAYRENVLRQVKSLLHGSGLVGISSMAESVSRTTHLIKEIKRWYDIPVIWGGIGPTVTPQESLKYADIVCIGEGEEAMKELVDKIEKGEDYSKIANFWIRKREGTIKNDVRPLIQDLDMLPFPDYDLQSQLILEATGKLTQADEYVKRSPEAIHSRHILVHTTRGCPYKCTFCCNNTLNKIYRGKGKIMRNRSFENVLAELERLVPKSPRSVGIWFTDDTFFLRSVGELEDFSREYKKRIGLPFQCNATATSIREDKLQVMIEGGLHRVMMGIQSGSEQFNRQIYNRPISNKSIIQATKLLSKYQERIEYPFYHIIIFNPFEKSDDLVETINLLRILPKPFYLEVYNLIFIPGSRLYEKAIEEGILAGGSKYNLNYYDSFRNLIARKTNIYLNTLLYLMRGANTEHLFGTLPAGWINFLLNHRRSRLYRIILLGLYGLYYLKGLSSLLFRFIPKKINARIKEGLTGIKRESRERYY